MKEEKKVADSMDEEKMKTKFRNFRKIIQAIEIILIGSPILLIVITFFSIGVMIEETGVDEESITNEAVVENNTSDISTTEYEENSFIQIKDFGNETTNIIASVVAVIAFIADWVITIILLEQLRKIFYEVETKGTPFTEKSVMHIDKISKLTIILGVLRIISAFVSNSELGASLTFIIIILAISSIFKYGYKLQKESDETL
jgi:hypothetical protein